jgi:dihydroorotase
VIDPHVHLRDWAQSAKETLAHGIEVAWQSGLDAVFDMPNTDPPLTERATVARRLAEAEAVIERLAIPFYYGVILGATPDPDQLSHMVELYHGERLGKNGRQVGAVGFKLYAGPSTGNLAAETEDAQQAVYRRLTELGYGGVICVHCEKSCLFRRRPDGSLDWDPDRPETFADTRPPESEIESVRDQLAFATSAGFAGTLHIAHVSVPEVVEIIEAAREEVGFRISCEATPHHLLFSDRALSAEGGMLKKTNPPLRPEPMRAELVRAVRDGRVDFLASDHAPHTLSEKTEGYASGIPGVAVMHRLRDRLSRERVDGALLERLFHRGAEEIYGVEIPHNADVVRADAALDYEANPYDLDEI